MSPKPSKIVWFSGSAVVFGTSLIVWMLLAFLTGIIGICPTASETWTYIYILLGVAILPASIWAGYIFSKQMSRLS